jgi:putative ABC transport system substrate-binding protein
LRCRQPPPTVDLSERASTRGGLALNLASALITIVLAVSTLGVVAEAQSPRPDVPRVGVIATRAGYEAFQNGLRALFYTNGEDIILEFRSTERQGVRLPDVAAELVRMKVDVILAASTAAVLAAKAATSTIPIVMLASDPVDSGIVDNAARPGGNVTGLSFNEQNTSAKRLELLKEALPSAARVAVLAAPNAVTTRMLRDTEAMARTIGVEIHSLPLHGPETFDKAFKAMVAQRADSLIVLPAAGVLANRARIITLTIKNKLPAMFWRRDFVDAGGLMSYGPDQAAMYRRAAGYVSKILLGAKPADLPIEQPSKFELGLNLQAARTLGVTIPRAVLLQADHIIE